jgi:penicillin-binding protein 1A
MYTPRRRAKHVKKQSRFRFIRIIVVLLFVIGAGLGFGYIFAAFQSLPTVSNNMRPAASSQIFDSKGKLLTTLHSEENRLPIDINKVPQNLQNAFIAAEDARFYDHIGVDPRGIFRALWANMTNRGIAQGGSTITQQLAKNAFLTQEQTLKRKIQEAMLAIEIERKYSKKEILEMYMNQIYFGQGAYGIQTAAKVYFDKDVEQLTLPQCAVLAGLPQSPNYYSPFNNLNASKERQGVVLDQMEKYGYITHTEATKAKNDDLGLTKKKKAAENPESAYFIDYVAQVVAEKYGEDALYKEGLKIYTTLDTDKQHAAHESLRHLPDNYKDDNGLTQPQVAIVSVDPHNGHILAMIGGRGQDSFNRATMAERQPGSAFKPFVYAAALTKKKLTPDSSMEDKKVTYGGWSPKNSSNSYSGTMSLRQALAMSVNTIAVQLCDEVGSDEVISTAEKMGIHSLVKSGSTNDRNLAMALGGLTRGVTPLDMASAYGTFANKGVHVAPTPIVKILDRNGNVLEDENNSRRDTAKTSALSERVAYYMTSMLESVVQYGTGTGANIGRPMAGKTGTTDDNKDAWFVGYTPDIVTAVWIGDDTGSHSLGEVYGGTIPATIWRDYMEDAVKGSESHDFSVPTGMEKLTPVKREAPKASTTEKKSADTTKAKETNKANNTSKEKTDTQQQPAVTNRNSKQQ